MEQRFRVFRVHTRFPVKEGKVYFVRLAAGGKNVNGSLKAYLTVTVPEGNPFKNSPTVKSDRTEKLTLDTKSEEAYYTIDIPSKGVLSLGLDYEISSIRTILYDEDGNKVVPYDKSAELGSAQINTGSKYGYGSWKSSEKSGKCSFDYNVDAGTYYIWVSNTGNSNGTGDIRLTPTFTKESDAALTLLSVRVSKGGSSSAPRNGFRQGQHSVEQLRQQHCDSQQHRQGFRQEKGQCGYHRDLRRHLPFRQCNCSINCNITNNQKAARHLLACGFSLSKK